MSLPYGRLLLLTFEMFFSLLLPLPLFLSNAHTRRPTHTQAQAQAESSTDTHTHCFLFAHTFQRLSILSLKGIAFQAWIKQMGLRKQVLLLHSAPWLKFRHSTCICSTPLTYVKTNVYALSSRNQEYRPDKCVNLSHGRCVFLLT